MNRVELRGGLTRDPDVKTFDSGATMTTVTIAVNGARWNSQKGEQEVHTIYVTCVSMGPIAAEMMSLNRGDEIYVVGELDQFKKENKDAPSTRVKVLHMTVIRESTRRQQQGDQGGGDDPWKGQDDPWAK